MLHKIEANKPFLKRGVLKTLGGGSCAWRGAVARGDGAAASVLSASGKGDVAEADGSAGRARRSVFSVWNSVMIWPFQVDRRLATLPPERESFRKHIDGILF